MEWSQYTFAEAIHRTQHGVLQNERLSSRGKADHLQDLLCLMVKRLPKDWGTETKRVLEANDCKAEELMSALDTDLHSAGFQPAQYAIFGALRQLILTIRDLCVKAESEPDERSIVARQVNPDNRPSAGTVH
ncbi:MAG TPA: hypothetical protein VFH43_09295 [Candidatus Kapabacteria bacterium]|nr:hypothetical protein [Candidatus Kapabacteria bacterium]